MISRYLKYVGMTLLMGLALAGSLSIRSIPFDIGALLLALFFGIAFTSQVTVRLPLFRDCLKPAPFSEPLHGAQGLTSCYRAAPVLSALMAGGCFAASAWILGVDGFGHPSFFAGAASGFMCFHYLKGPR